MFDPDGYWTPADAASVLANWGAQGKLPADWGFVADGQSMDILDLPNEATAAHLIGGKLAAGKVQGWAREAKSGCMIRIPARCWRIEPSLRDVFRDGSLRRLSVSMSQVGDPGLPIDSPAEIYIHRKELLACLELAVVDAPYEPRPSDEDEISIVDTARTDRSDDSDIIVSERGGSRYRAFCAFAAPFDLDRLRRPLPKPPQHKQPMLSGKTTEHLLSKWLALQTRNAIVEGPAPVIVDYPTPRPITDSELSHWFETWVSAALESGLTYKPDEEWAAAKDHFPNRKLSRNMMRGVQKRFPAARRGRGRPKNNPAKNTAD